MNNWLVALIVTFVGAFLQRMISLPFSPGPVFPGTLGAFLLFWFVIGVVMGIAYLLKRRPRLWVVAAWVTLIVGFAATLGMIGRFANSQL